MSNLRANAERFKAKETERLQKAAHEQRRLGIVKRHRENTVGVLRNLLQSFPCPVSQPAEAGDEAALALLELAAGFESHKPPAEAIKVYQEQVIKARSRKISARDTHESQLLADIVGSVCVDPELVEITDSGDGQKVPTLPDMPKPWCDVLALALQDEKVPADKLFEGLSDGDKQLLRSGLEGAQAVVKDKLKEAYINMVRQAEGLLRQNKRDREEEAKDAVPAPAGEGLAAAAESLASDLAYAVGVLHSLADLSETPPDEKGDLQATANRVSAVIAKLKAAANEDVVSPLQTETQTEIAPGV